VTLGSRKQRADGARTRERILAEALPLFAARGFAGTSVRQVAASAEVNVATLAYHFSDKQGLYDAVVSRLHADLERDFPQDLMRSSSPEGLVAELVDRAWAFVQSHREPIRLQLRHVLDHGRQPDVVVEELSEPLLVRADAVIALFRPDWSPARRRLLVLSWMHALVRLSIEDSGQLSKMMGETEDLDSEIRSGVTEMLCLQLGLRA